MRTPTLVEDTAPTTEPLTTAEAKKHLRVDIADDDTYIDALVAAARQYAETATNRQFVSATWDAIWDWFPPFFTLRKPPLQSVTSIIYLDSAGASQTLSSSEYQVITSREPGEVHLAPTSSWPTTESGRLDAVTVKYIAGYGAASAVPDGIKQAILLLVGAWYENREQIVVGAVVNELKGSVAADSLLQSYTVPEIR